MEDHARTYITMNTLHLCVPASIGSNLRKHGRFAFRTPEGEIVHFLILDIAVRDMFIYPLQILGKDPTQFVKKLCRHQESVFVDLLDAHGLAVPGIPSVEIKRY